VCSVHRAVSVLEVFHPTSEVEVDYDMGILTEGSFGPPFSINIQIYMKLINHIKNFEQNVPNSPSFDVNYDCRMPILFSRRI